MTRPASVTGLHRLAATAGRFGLVGLLCALLNISIIYVGHDVLGWHYIVAAGGTCFVTIPLGYLLHGSFSFNTGRPAAWREFMRFVVVQLGQFALGLALLALLVEGLGMAPVWAMVAVSIVMVVYAFVASSTWVYGIFRHTPRQRPPERRRDA